MNICEYCGKYAYVEKMHKDGTMHKYCEECLKKGSSTAEAL